LLAVPTLLAAGGYSLLKYDRGLSVQDLWLLVVGFIVSFVTAYVVSKWFLGFIRTNTFIPFAYYRIVLGLLVLAYFGYKMM
jgi:undecaprenyl-diphosphatase